MHLSIAGWPPVASHVACLLVGSALANIGAGSTEARPDLPAKAVAMTLAAESFARPSEPLRRGDKLMLAREDRTCLLGKDAVVVLDVAPSLLVSVPYAGAAALTRAASLLTKREKVALLRAPDAAALPQCHSQPQVVYGAR